MTGVDVFAVVMGGLLGFALLWAAILHARVLDLRRELKDTRDELRRARGDLYQHQDQYARAMELLGLEWGPGNPPGWRRKP